MSFIIMLLTLSSVYIFTFKDDFTKDNVDKAATFTIIMGLICLIIGGLASSRGGA